MKTSPLSTLATPEYLRYKQYDRVRVCFPRRGWVCFQCWNVTSWPGATPLPRDSSPPEAEAWRDGLTGCGTSRPHRHGEARVATSAGFRQQLYAPSPLNAACSAASPRTARLSVSTDGPVGSAPFATAPTAPDHEQDHKVHHADRDSDQNLLHVAHGQPYDERERAGA